MAVENKRMWQRGALEADLLAADEVPADREMIVASDTGRVWPGDGVSPLSARPFLVTADPMTGQMPDDVREVIAANLADPTTPEGSVLAAAIAAGGGGGGGSAPLTYDATTGLYTVPDGSSLAYDSASGLYSTN